MTNSIPTEILRLTTVRHGNKDSLVEWLVKQSYSLTVVEGSRKDLQSLEPKDRFYGHLLAGCKILLVEAGEEKIFLLASGTLHLTNLKVFTCRRLHRGGFCLEARE